MGYDIRTLATLATQTRQFFVQAVPGALVRLWANTFTVFGKVFALLDFEHEMRRQWLFDQLFASTAAEVWLKRHGYELGLTPDAGTAPSGSAMVASTAGIVIPAGTQFQRADGVTYSTVAPITAADVTVDLVLQCDTAGEAYNVDPGDTLTLIDTAAVPYGLGTTATVDPAGIEGGVDPEALEAFRARVLYRKSNPPQGGSAPDYTEWAGEALATVKNVFVDSFANDHRSVWLCFTVTDTADSVPTDGEVAIVQAYANDPVRRPITARVFATGPTPVPQDIVLSNVAPLTPDMETAIAAEVSAMFADDVQPATPSTPFILYEEQLEAAIARTYGLKRFTLVSPRGDQTFTTGGQMPTLGSIAYQ